MSFRFGEREKSNQKDSSSFTSSQKRLKSQFVFSNEHTFINVLHRNFFLLCVYNTGDITDTINSDTSHHL